MLRKWINDFGEVCSPKILTYPSDREIPMRMFIYNNRKLKYIIQNGGVADNSAMPKTLFEWADPLIGAKGLQNDARKKNLWAAANQSMKKITFHQSGKLLFAKSYTSSTTNRAVYRNRDGLDDFFDLYMDRGTGWVALAKNYNIFIEMSNSGTLDNKKKNIENNNPSLWNDYTQTMLWGLYSSSGVTVDAEALKIGKKVIIPPAVGNFYGDSTPMKKNDFQLLSVITNKLVCNVKALIQVEWPAIVYDREVFGVLAQDKNTWKESNQKRAVAAYELWRNDSQTWAHKPLILHSLFREGRGVISTNCRLWK
ncbi:MAG: hypothetical protein JKY54_07895 [Flavobacteriales bacterium]|nr:hypothetical protein [Flavobacteriales bacterium]